ncbi:MAG: FAD-binding oxidoreductase, partial [Acidimicrobiia bacterium]
GYVRDWTGRWTGHSAAVVRPGSVAEVQAVVTTCHRAGLAVVPQGGNTGLVGGSVPHHGEVVLSLRRLDLLGPVDPMSRSVTVGAGATIGAVREHARRSALRYGVDLASRDSATIGGTIATNAGGTHVVSNGDTRRQVLGLEVVLADGTRLSRLDRMPKESLGPDPLQLMIGSEGTLGVITSARLRLLPGEAGAPMVILVAVQTLSEGLGFLGSDIRAIEFFDKACLEAVIDHRGLVRPLPVAAPFYLLIESDGTPSIPEDAVTVVDRSLWAYRESITETISGLGVPVKLDVAVPLDRVDDFAGAVKDLDLDGDTYLFGHLAEGNFHVNILGVRDPETVLDRVLEVVVGLGGVIASEHGVGVAKADWWRRTMEPSLLAFHRRIKEALDPDRILNPAVFGGD